jgi:hypothetical protein
METIKYYVCGCCEKIFEVKDSHVCGAEYKDPSPFSIFGYPTLFPSHSIYTCSQECEDSMIKKINSGELVFPIVVKKNGMTFLNNKIQYPSQPKQEELKKKFEEQNLGMLARS